MYVVIAMTLGVDAVNLPLMRIKVTVIYAVVAT